MKRSKLSLSIGAFFLLLLSIIPHLANASATDGTIDSTYHYAWSENVGFIDFGSSVGNVHVTDSGLTGYAYGENVGWISLNCSNTSSCGTVHYAVANDGNGNLSGYAWGENIGWIDFSHVTIGSDGIFAGYAYGENIGNIIFGTIAGDKVLTDWRPASSRQSQAPAVSTPAPSGGVAITQGELQAMSDALRAQITAAFNAAHGITTPITIAPSASTKPVKPTFTLDLTYRSRGKQVQELQQYLNAHGYPVAATGSGASGNETTYFGLATQAALAKFQKANHIIPSSGYFGVKTRGFINKALNN
jgi:hypothetical protein